MWEFSMKIYLELHGSFNIFSCFGFRTIQRVHEFCVDCDADFAFLCFEIFAAIETIGFGVRLEHIVEAEVFADTVSWNLTTIKNEKLRDGWLSAPLTMNQWWLRRFPIAFNAEFQRFIEGHPTFYTIAEQIE